MEWAEAIGLVGVLLQDPSSWLQAAVAGWETPRSAEWFVLADLFDLTHAANSKRRPKPMPRPFGKERNVLGRAVKHTQETIRAALSARGHGIGGGHGS